MSEKNIFRDASKLKLRYPYNQGLLATEDLWDLPLPHLDEMAVSLDATASAKKTYLANADHKVSKEAALDKLRQEVILEVISVREAAAAEKRNAARIADQRKLFEDLLEGKKAEALRSLSAEELEARLAQLR